MHNKSEDADLTWTEQEQISARMTRMNWEDRTLILDFDETLWLRNSTEEFLAAARPSILAAIVLQLLGFLKPWSLLSKRDPARYRDAIRVFSVILVAPWTLFFWRRAAKRLGPQHLNHELFCFAERSGATRIVVATYGFDIIVQPLLKAIQPNWSLGAAATFRNTELRRLGKGEALERSLGRDSLARSVVITDNFIDRDIGRLCDHAFYVCWKDAVFKQAGLRPMLPLGYLSKIKRPNERYILNGVIGYDFIVLWLAFVMGSGQLIGLTIAIAFYLLAFFAVYEIGYYENDVKGLKTESNPVVSDEFHRHGRNFSETWAWSFGIVLAAFGAFVQALSAENWIFAENVSRISERFLQYWVMSIVLLGATRATFFWFNSIKPQRRIVPMLLLQLQRTLGYMMMLPIGLIGGLLCVSHAIGRWVPYVIYRYGGSRKHFPAHLCTFLIYLAFLPILFVAEIRLRPDDRFEFAIITFYLLARAAKDWRRFRDRDFADQEKAFPTASSQTDQSSHLADDGRTK